ncbi:phage tail-collar fiber domain-containing protein [Citrobacter werkmanii]|uniref:phage tail-collar fiber domain-containing protein n=1 Tax=Citrobacter werkmanii TaxID=67827 RepID=UPI00388E3680
MATKYFALLTNIGAAKLAKATALGAKVEITQMAVGDGNGVLPAPDPAQTALIHEIRRAPLNMLTVDPANASQIIAEQVIPEDVGGWWIREIGLFDKDGDMIAVANCAETYKPQLQEGSGRVQAIRVILIVSSTEAVTLKIDPAVVLATRQYVDNKIIEVKSYADGLMRTHEQSRNHPDATTTAKGFTQLNSSVTDDRETQAATPKAVKIAMDNANARLAKDRNLADLPNPALARQNLQLGNCSTKNTGTTANTVAAGDDVRITGAMQKNQNGADIPDVAKFLQNLHLEETVKLAKNALPLSGGRLTGPVSLLNENGKRLQIETAGNPTSNVFVVFTGTDERPCLIECKDEISYHFFSQRNPDGTITFQAAGKMIPLDYSNFDAKYQAKGNYAVKGDSYTKEETNLKFENEKISGVGSFSFLDKTSGLILKAAGVTFATEGDRVTFPEAFPNICRAVVLTLNGSAGETTRNIVATNVSRTGFSIARGSNEAGVFWMAIGV